MWLEMRYSDIIDSDDANEKKQIEFASSTPGILEETV